MLSLFLIAALTGAPCQNCNVPQAPDADIVYARAILSAQQDFVARLNASGLSEPAPQAEPENPLAPYANVAFPTFLVTLVLTQAKKLYKAKLP